jgi:hypothetical protein
VSTVSEIADDAETLARQCYPIFAGHPAPVQGAALVELVARHLAGHVLLGDPNKTKQLRADILKEFVRTVEALVPIIDADVIQPHIKARAQ